MQLVLKALAFLDTCISADERSRLHCAGTAESAVTNDRTTIVPPQMVWHRRENKPESVLVRLWDLIEVLRAIPPAFNPIAARLSSVAVAERLLL